MKKLKEYNPQGKISLQLLTINPFEFLMLPLFPFGAYVKGIQSEF